MSEQHKAIARLAFEDVQNHRNLALTDDLFATDYLGHTPLGEIDGLEGAKQFIAACHRAFPDLRVSVVDQVAEGDKVVTCWMARGTHDGQFQAMRPTGKPITITGITVFRMADDKIIESWTNANLFQRPGDAPQPAWIARLNGKDAVAVAGAVTTSRSPTG